MRVAVSSARRPSSPDTTGRAPRRTASTKDRISSSSASPCSKLRSSRSTFGSAPSSIVAGLRTIESSFCCRSIDRYASAWNTRSLRSALRLMRLAVTSATQPFAKRMRAFAMSISSVNTGAPIASIDAIGERTMCSIRSMSWIMRSSTTLTSVPRGLNGASRFDSMKRGRGQLVRDGEDHGVEPLQVADLQHEPLARGERDQLARLVGRRRDRLLDQHVGAGGEEVAGDRRGAARSASRC